MFTDVWAGSYDTLAQTDKDEVLACGLNNYSQLGISKGMLFHTLTKSKGLSQKWAQIAFGQHHALCLDHEGKVYAIGRADYGRLGLGKEATDEGKSDAKASNPFLCTKNLNYPNFLGGIFLRNCQPDPANFTQRKCRNIEFLAFL